MSQVKQYADKVRAIDDEIASMQAMMQECGGGKVGEGGVGGAEQKQREKVRDYFIDCEH